MKTQTAAQRYNKRLFKTFENAERLGQERYKEDAEKIKLLTAEINRKAQKFTQEKRLHFDDLLHVIEKLTEINTFLK